MREETTVGRRVGTYTVLLLSLLALVAVCSVIIPVRNASASGTISGTVYLDYNLNGARNTSGSAPNFAVDKGVSGVTVTVYDAAGVQRGTAVSSGTGSYSISAAGTGPYRVEFTSLPTGYMPGTVGSNNSSAVRFVPDGNSTNVDFGVITIEDYCQNAPELVTTCFAGTVGGNSAATVLVSFPYDSGTTSRTSSAGVLDPQSHNLMVPQNDVGSIWGLSFHRRSQKIFAAAFTKRHAGFRNDNQGTASNDPTGEIFISNTTGTSGSLFVNLNSLFGSNIAGDNPHEISDYETDTGAFDGVGTTGFGDIDLSADEQTLYAVNLYDRNLYAVPLGSGTPTPPTSSSQVTVYNLAALTNPGTGATGCALDTSTPAGEMNLNLRPGALKVLGSKIYVGLTCTAQSTGNTGDLRAFIYELNPAGAGSAVQVANFALNYPRGCVSNNGTICAPAEWQPWADDFTDLLDYAPWTQKYLPQPWLMDIEFDQNGFMILGFGDRTGHQTGNYNSGANTGTVEGVSAGDTLRMYKTGSTWTLESNGSDNTNTSAGAGTGDGPGNGEFYFEEGYTITSNVHSEVGLGGLMNVPGFQDVVVSAFDPAPTNTLPSGQNTYRAGGLIWLNNNIGNRSRSYQLFSIDAPNTFGKASGIGDLEAICENAPLQVGNRVWNDTDGDGVQDPGEGVFANVGLEMWADTDSDGIPDTLIGNATTDANGNYLFGGPNNTNLGLPCGAPTTGSVDVRVSGSSDDAEQLANNSVTTNSGDLDMLKDGNGTGNDQTHVGVRFQNVTIPAGATITNAYIEFVANNSTTVSGGSPTFNIHAENVDNAVTYAATNNNLGNTTTRPRTSATVSWSPAAWSNGNVAPPTPNLSAIVQEVVNRSGWNSGQAMSFIISGTAANNVYREAESFDGNTARAPRLVVQYSVTPTCTTPLKPATAYEVRVKTSNFNTGNALANFLPTVPDNDPSANGDARDSDGIVFPGDSVRAPFTTGDYGSNNHRFDFGFRPNGAVAPIFSLGNRVWLDTDNDGIIDPAESGISGVSVSVFLDAGGDGIPDTPGSPIATITTDANGYYRFDSLISNTYVVRINPVNFAPGALLEGYRNTGGNNTADVDSFGAALNAENGVNPTTATAVLTNGLLSNPITLAPVSEPANEPDVPTTGSYAGQGSLDQFADMTVDFGFFGLSLSGTVWDDRGGGLDTNDGQLDAAEDRVPGIVVKLYDNAGIEVPVGPDGILGTADDALGGVVTDASGSYRFESLAEGDYRVVIKPAGAISSIPTEADPNLNGDSNDNGYPDNTGSYPGDVISGLVTLTAGYAGAAGNNVVNMAAGHTANPTVDFGLLLAPSQISLDKFDAHYKEDKVVLEWSTGGEVDNLGFNVYRTNGGGSDLLNSAPIAGSALRTTVRMKVTGDDYSWIDDAPESGASYYLEDIDLNGVTTIHGPIYPKFDFSYSPEKPASALLTGIGESVGWQAQKELVVEASSENLFSNERPSDNRMQVEISGTGGVKITIRGDDRYRVSFAELASAGFDTGSNPDYWQLFADGFEVPVAIDDPSVSDRKIEFFGKSFESRFTDKQVFYLVEGTSKGQRLPTTEEKVFEGKGSVNSFRVTAISDQKAFYVTSILNGDKENWFGMPVFASQDRIQELVVANPDQTDGRDARLRVKLQGLSREPHLVNVTFNGSYLGSVEFSEIENREFEFAVPMSAVLNGANSVQLRSAAGPSDISLLDGISFRYSRRYAADEDRLRFSVKAGQSARVSGFDSDDLEIFELDENGQAIRKINVPVEKVNGSFGFGLKAYGKDREFAAYGNGYNPISGHELSRDYPTKWRSPKNQADLLILAPGLFAKPAEQLANMRTAQGFDTRVVLVEDIYDEYGFGRKSDTAIYEFLRDAVTTWEKSPDYVILFGDSSYDMRNYLNQPNRDFIPTKLFDSKVMETASDALLADFDEDGIEDVGLGRLPAASQTEAAALISKLARYDRQGKRTERSNLLVADNGFENQNLRLNSLLPKGVTGIVLNRSSLSDIALHDRIIDEMNRNAMIVTYSGHGSTGVWGSNAVFDQDDPAALTNERLSFVMVLSCLSGFSHNPSNDSLGEKMLKAENGAAAVWASSGSTYPGNQIAMGETMTTGLFQGRNRIGDLTRQAKQSTNDVDARLTWQLIGDPTTVIR